MPLHKATNRLWIHRCCADMTESQQCSWKARTYRCYAGNARVRIAYGKPSSSGSQIGGSGKAAPYQPAWSLFSPLFLSFAYKKVDHFLSGLSASQSTLSLIYVFITIMSATMLVTIEECISQAKWQWFREYRALKDIKVYDQASRGP